MNIEERHALLRSKLDKLGFNQPLPIGSFAIVTALLNDLVLTTSSLKVAKNEISRLNEEKESWDLGIEPYKCDNSRLLAECNALHLKLLKDREEYEMNILDLNTKIRKLKLDKQNLREECKELSEKYHELELQMENPRYHKNQTNQALKNRKPFISTVRSGDFFSKQSGLVFGNDDDKLMSPSKISQHRRFIAIEMEQNNVQCQAELIELFKSQIESRNREISRLNGLLIGGRPASALLKDCCYHGVVSLNTDLDALQKQKAEIHKKYEDTIRSQQGTMNRTVYLTEKNRILMKELAEIKEVALNAENDANQTLGTLHQKNTQLKLKLNEMKKRIVELEEKLRKYSREKLFSEKSDAIIEEQFERIKESEQQLKIVVEKLTKKNNTLKTKLIETKNRNCNCCQMQNTHEPTTIPSEQQSIVYSAEFGRLKADRDFFQQEYLKLLQSQTRDTEIDRLRLELKEKDTEIFVLRKGNSTRTIGQKCRCDMTNESVQSTINRLEREKNQLIESIDGLSNECDKLQKQLHLTTSTHCDQIAKHECEIDVLKEKIHELQAENCDLQFAQGPRKSTIELLKNELKLSNAQVTDLKHEIDKIQSSYQQLKSVQERTECALIDQQSQLSHRSHHFKSTESCLNMMETHQCLSGREINDLKTQLSRLKGINEILQREKDQLIIKLDSKTEKLHKLESRYSNERDRVINLSTEVASARQQLEFAHMEKHKSHDSMQHITSEIDIYRQQIDRLKRTNDNAMRENTRLTNELAESECKNCQLKGKLAESEKEIECLKSQLQQYVQEVQRAEELLLRKEEERDEMLEFYKTLSQDAIILEGNNQSLEIKAAESKRNLSTIESKLREREIESERIQKDKDVLLQKIDRLEVNLQREGQEKDKLKRELDATKELCAKLDIEKEKLRAEVNEYAQIRRELEREIEKMHNDLLVRHSDDKCIVERLQTEIVLLKNELENEKKNLERSETLAKEYNIQLRELRRKLLDDRVQQDVKQLSRSNDRFSSF